MEIKKIIAAALALCCTVYPSGVFAQEGLTDEDIQIEWNAFENRGLYDLSADKDLQAKWDVFANKYPYNIELQDEIFWEHLEKNPNLGLVGISAHDDGTGFGKDVSIGYYDDRFAYSFESEGALSKTETKLIVDGEAEFPCVIFKSRSLVPAAAFEKAGCEVATDEESRVTSISKNGVTIELMPYLLGMRKNREEGYWLPMEICSRYFGENREHYVPLRAVAEELGLTVDWDGDNRAALLYS